MERIVVALLVAPVIVVLALDVIATVWLGPAGGRDTGFVLIMFVLPVAYLSNFLFGLPLYLLWKRRGWLSWWHSMAGGFLCAIPFAGILLYGNPTSNSVQFLVGICFAVGALVGLVFWALLRIFHSNLRPNESFERDA